MIKIDFQSETPIYQQLYQEIIKGIAAKKLLPGDPLPSVRLLAQDLGINLHTVNKTYALLKQEGFVQIHRQKGVEINTEQMPKAEKEYLSKLEENLRNLIAEAIVRNLSEEEFLLLSRDIYKDYLSQGGK